MNLPDSNVKLTEFGQSPVLKNTSFNNQHCLIVFDVVFQRFDLDSHQ